MTPAELRAARAATSLTQTEWGLLLGIGQKHVSKLETGAVPPSDTLVALVRIIAAIGVKRARSILDGN